MSIEQEVSAGKHVPGDIAIWVLVFAELFEFGLFFILYIVAKVHNPELFKTGPLSLNTSAGILNTFILLTSSYFIARSVRSKPVKPAKFAVSAFCLVEVESSLSHHIDQWKNNNPG
ncbi:hypothetical protein A3755_16205 [Oleiphilus sp. HI0085]|nr:hypothetical protein A3755_16205 [Oleiphilus sp. HI0085]